MARGTITRTQAPAVRSAGGRARPFTVAFDSRTAWDFLVSVAIGEGPDHDLVAVDREWHTRTREALPDDLRAAQDRLFGAAGYGALEGLQPLAAANADVRTAADVVRLLETIRPSDLLAATIRECLAGDVPEELVERASAGDRGAIGSLEPSLCAPEVASMVSEFTADAERSMRLALEVTRAWLTAFEPIEPRLARIHAADVASRQDVIASRTPAEAVEIITGGLRLLPESRLRRVLLGPSVFVRPFNFINQGSDWRMFWYPVADEVLETDAGAPSNSMVRLFRALGDPTRLQVLRLLTERDWYLTELATRVELSKPTMKHHLALLRAAGLVTVIEEGALTYYRLRRERLSEGGSELRRYLG
jgi:DNA-binding transcriptional ArsR family regulator